MRTETKGFWAGLLAATAYGIMPLCTLPLMSKGMTVDTILFYRFLLASMSLALWMTLRHEPFYLALRDIIALAIITLFYVLAAILVFVGYYFLPGGIVTTIHFLYPVVVAAIMMFFFREKKSLTTFLAIILAVGGVALLSFRGGSADSPSGVVMVLFSALALAIFLVGMKWLSARRGLNGNRVSLCILIVSAVPCLLISLCGGHFSFFPDVQSLLIMLVLAFVSGAFAMLALNYSLQTVGPTVTSVVGAMEPLTAVVIGTIVFDEKMTPALALGILCILVAVGCVVLAPHFAKKKSS